MTKKVNLFRIFQKSLIGFLIIFAILFIIVAICTDEGGIIASLFGLSGIPEIPDPKHETLKFIGIAMGGILLALQALMAYKRAKAMEATAKAQAESSKAQAESSKAHAKSNEYTERGQRQERMKNAIEHLGSNSDSIRLGGAYELFHLAEDTEELRQTIFDILCAHIRRTTREKEYQKKYSSKPSEEIQSLLTLLFTRNRKIFSKYDINLQRSWLSGAYLSQAHLYGADFSNSTMNGSIFRGAFLQDANFEEAILKNTIFESSKLQGANFIQAKLQEANLSNAYLQGSCLNLAKLHAADLVNAQLQGANLLSTELQGTILEETQFKGVQCDSSVFQLNYFSNRINKYVGRESDLENTIFSGEIDQNDIDEILLKPNKIKMNKHIGKPPLFGLPRNCGAITGSYTAKDAQDWINEHREAMSEVPHKGSGGD